MASPLRNPAFLKHEDFVGMLDRTQPVGDDYGRPAFHLFLHVFGRSRVQQIQEAAGYSEHKIEEKSGSVYQNFSQVSSQANSIAIGLPAQPRIFSTMSVMWKVAGLLHC